MKIIKYIIPLIFMILAIAIMEGGSYLKNTRNGNKIPEILNEIETDINNDDWTKTENKANAIKSIFNNVSKIIQFSVERDELVEFKFNLAYLEGYIKSQDTSNAISQIYVLKEYWKELR